MDNKYVKIIAWTYTDATFIRLQSNFPCALEIGPYHAITNLDATDVIDLKNTRKEMRPVKLIIYCETGSGDRDIKLSLSRASQHNNIFTPIMWLDNTIDNIRENYNNILPAEDTDIDINIINDIVQVVTPDNQRYPLPENAVIQLSDSGKPMSNGNIISLN